MNIFISLVFVAVNTYFSVQSFRQKRWGWGIFSAALALFCAAPLIETLL